MSDNQKVSGLIALYLLMVSTILVGILLTMPQVPYMIAIAASVIASLLICGFAISMAGQPGGTAAQTFFAKSVTANSRAVIVISTSQDLAEVMYRLKAAGLQPMVATV